MHLIIDWINTIHDVSVAFIIVINKKYFPILFMGTVTRFDIPFAQNMLVIREICGCWASMGVILSLWCLLVCHMWFAEDVVPALVLLLPWLALPLWDEGYWSWQSFWSQWEPQRAHMEYILLLCWWWTVQLGKGQLNMSLDLFSGIQIVMKIPWNKNLTFF